jgi:hypothetical protein
MEVFMSGGAAGAKGRRGGIGTRKVFSHGTISRSVGSMGAVSLRGIVGHFTEFKVVTTGKI